MAKINLGTPQEAELTALVLAKLNDYGWADNDVLANFIVVMVANEKSKDDITSELNDILPGEAPAFVDWLFGNIDGISGQAQASQQIHENDVEISSKQDQDGQQSMEMTDTAPPSHVRQRSSNSSGPHASGRLLQSAISGAIRSDNASSPSHRQAPSRVYDNERPAPRRSARERSVSPVRSQERGLTTSRRRDEQIRFRRSSEERAEDETRINSRLGNGTGNDKDRLRGRLGGRIEDRLGKRNDQRSTQSRERSWDKGSDYHDRRAGRNQRNGNNRSGEQVDLEALRNIESRLGTRSSNNRGRNDDFDSSRSRNSERKHHTEASSLRQSNTTEQNVTRCRFWPNCAQTDTCQYWHPRELCADFPNCPKTSDTCLYIHPLAEPTAEQLAAAARQALLQSMRNAPNNKVGTGAVDGDDSSTNTQGFNALQMPFALGSHPLVQECKFGARCTRADCKFRHPQKDFSTQQQQQQQQQQQCKFFPNCTKPNCPFYHPTTEQTADSTMDITGTPTTADSSMGRLPTPCRFGDQCTRAGCHFTHPRDGSATSAMPLCKFNPCTRPGCPFRHVPGMTANKSLVLNGSHRGNTSDRFAAGIVDDSEVEKLHVPASSHWASGGVSQGNQPQESGDGTSGPSEMDMDMDVAI
ncbi:hypothetical protein BGZ76_005183 [Entomortierella beljakovae]|nr:hypothetical protein BGZ76_005183 [Entomortierella beljakovae]